MKYLRSSAIVALALCSSSGAWADEVTIVAPGGIRCPIDRIAPDFETKTSHKVKATFGSGGGTHEQVVRGEPFASEMRPTADVEVLGPLPKEISPPTAFVGFITARAKTSEPSKALLSYLASSEAAAAYTACAMQPGR